MNTISNRMRAILHAVDAGRVELTCSCEPDLRIDGLLCSDQMTAHDLVRSGLIHAPGLAVVGSWVPARLTVEGQAALRPSSLNGSAAA
jgi:hypothetical protein